MIYTTLIPEHVRHVVEEEILGVVNGTVFYNSNGDALILGDDHSWIARVTHDEEMAYTEEAYLSTQPIESYLGVRENEHAYQEDDLPALKGFETGFTA